MTQEEYTYIWIVKIVVAHHPYEATRDDEISFEKEEVIKVTDASDPDWWVGKKKDGSLGFFPSNVRMLFQINYSNHA